MSVKLAWAVLVAIFVSVGFSGASAQAVSLESVSTLRGTTKKIILPDIEQPAWLKKQISDEKAAAAAAAASRAQSTPSSSGRVVTYRVEQRGVTSADFSAFAANANQTLNDGRGWARLGMSFKQVSSGGEFVLVLASPGEVARFSTGCSAEWSCRVGQYVIINQDRWVGGTTAWNNAGGGLRDYQHMVINHEVGHWLGHDHATCSGNGNLAPMMLQQSIDLQGCKFNAWPLKSELWTSR